MAAFSLLTFLLLLVSPCLAAPARIPPVKFNPFDPRGLLCKIPVIENVLCPRSGSSSVTVNTKIGTARGTLDASGANRFTARYATASRWQQSTVANTWALPNGGSDVTALPLACPQPNVDSSSTSEDCLSVILYVPKTLTSSSGVPTFMWIHGGSFIVGSATDPGLDGSELAIATNSIVAVVQYRLGALGFMAPDGQTNLAVRDIMNALQFLKTVVPSFGGSASKITVAGQSAGANMVRALLATPSASTLFQSGIMQSDPIDYGFLAPSVQQNLQANFNSLINCGATDTDCQKALSVDSIINAEMNLFSNAINIDPSATRAQPMRPVRDGSLITTPLDSTGSYPSQSKPLLITNVATEAGPAIFGQFLDPIPNDQYEAFVNASLGTQRTENVLAAPFYEPAVAASGEGDVRPQLQTMGTDYVWKCAARTFARDWVSHGGKAFVGLYTLGATYPGNDGIPFCTQSGSVCHQDDIQIVFGTVPSPTSAQQTLTTEMQSRYKQFMLTGNPNSSGQSAWTAASTSDVHPKLLGSSGEDTAAPCAPSFWGQAVPYDYQVFNI